MAVASRPNASGRNGNWNRRIVPLIGGDAFHRVPIIGRLINGVHTKRRADAVRVAQVGATVGVRDVAPAVTAKLESGVGTTD